MKKISLAIMVLMLSAVSQAWAGDAAAGKVKAAQCAACHGAAGISPMGIYPNLAGQKEQYLVKQIKAFRDGERKDPSMKAMVSALSDADIANLAAYYARIK
jgi:Cytochrome c553